MLVVLCGQRIFGNKHSSYFLMENPNDVKVCSLIEKNKLLPLSVNTHHGHTDRQRGL